MRPENIESNEGRRIVATLIDYVVITAFFFWFVMTFGEPNDEGGKTVSGLPALMPVMFWFAWLILAEAFFGTTLGHEVVGLKVISFDGGKINIGHALKRRICDLLEIVFCFGVIAFIVVNVSLYHQRLGDLWAKTLVIGKNETFSPEFEFENSNTKE